jgi:hypothetical protein
VLKRTLEARVERAVDRRHVRMLRYIGDTREVEEEGDATQTDHDLRLVGLDDDSAAHISEETVKDRG